MRPVSFRKQTWLVAIGAALATGGVCLEILRPGPIAAVLVPLPAAYAATLAGFCFWFRGQHAASREQRFWRLWAAGCWLWTVAGLLSFFILGEPQYSTVQFFRLALTFLPPVLFMAALVMQPEISAGELRDPVVGYEAALVVLWWAFLYALIMGPWHWVQPNHQQYLSYFSRLHAAEDASVAIWLVALGLAAEHSWRRFYAHMAGAIILGSPSVALFLRSWNSQRWLPAMIFQALVAASFLWLSQTTRISTKPRPDEPVGWREPTLGVGAWLASITAVGIPVLAIWCATVSAAPGPVRRFRLFACFAAFAAAMLLLYRWQDVAEKQRERLVGELETAVQELRRLQGHFAEAEKLASLGQLAAGAAHEINNPVAAMYGYSELVRGDASASGRVQEFSRKIGDQTRRIRNLVDNLLSLTEQESREASLVDVAEPLRGALELRRISAEHRKQNLSLTIPEDSSLGVRADPGKLLQVFYRLLLAISEGDAEKKIEVRAHNDDTGARVLIEFAGRPLLDSAASSAPEVYNAQRVHQGKQLSMNVCYSIIQEQGGAIAHESLTNGGRMFRVELPAAVEAHSLPSTVSGD